MRRLLITLGIALVVLALWIGALSLMKKKTPAFNSTANSANNNSVPVSNSNTVAVNATPSPNSVSADQQAMTNVAITFTERYGSVSNQNPYQNLVDASSFMTERLRRQILASIPKFKPAVPEQYQGTTTRALSVAFDKVAAGSRALALVTAQRQDYLSRVGEQTPYQQKLSLTLVKENGLWLVDSMAWLPRG